MQKQIYFYSNHAYYEYRIENGDVPMLKIGETTQETVDQRIKQQDTTACALPLEKKGSYFTTFGDKEFHRHLLSLGYEKSRSEREFFYITVEDAERELLDYRDGVIKVDSYYEARPHQAWVNAVILDRWNRGSTMIQPANLCARFGKTLQGLDLFYQSGLKVMVVGSYWLGANESFIETVNKRFDITGDIVVVPPSYDEFIKHIDSDKRIVIDVSLHVDSCDIDEQLIEALCNYQSLIYVDEADYGAWKENQRNKLRAYMNTNNNLVVVATGTNIERAMIGATGTIEQPITVSYLDLIEAKRGEGMLFSDYQPTGELETSVIEDIRREPQKWSARLSDIVDVSCLNLEVNPQIAAELNQQDPTQIPSMTKVFSKTNNQVLKSAINDILFNENGEDVFGLYEAEYGSIENPAVMVFIPGGQADINNMVNVGRTMTGDQYNWVALHGGKGKSTDFTNRKAEKKIKDIIKNGSGYRTVIVSCSMGARSFSVPNIIAVVNCIDGGIMHTQVQRASRCLTPGLDKSIGLIVNYSFNTARSSSFEADLISSALDREYQDLESAIRRVYRLANFFTKDEYGYLTSLSESDFHEYVTSYENAENMASATVDYRGLLTDDNILIALENVTASLSKNSQWKGTVDRAISYIRTKKDEEQEIDEDAREVRDLVRKIKTIIECAGNAYYLAPDAKTFEQCLNIISNDEDKASAYDNLVGVKPDFVLSTVISFLPKTFMDIIIQRARMNEESIYFKTTTSTHVSGMFND